MRDLLESAGNGWNEDPREGRPWGPSRRRRKVERGAAKTNRAATEHGERHRPSGNGRHGPMDTLDCMPTSRELTLHAGRLAGSEPSFAREDGNANL